MTKVIARVYPVLMMRLDWAPGGRQPSDQASRLGLWVRRNWQLPSTSTIAIVIITQPISWYSFYRPMEGGRLSRPRHCRKGAQPVPKAAYRSSCHDKRPQCDSTWLAAAKLGRSVLSDFWTCRHRRQRRRGCRCRDPPIFDLHGSSCIDDPPIFWQVFYFFNSAVQIGNQVYHTTTIHGTRES